VPLVPGQVGGVAQQQVGPRRERPVRVFEAVDAGFQQGADPVRVSRVPGQADEQGAAPDFQLRFPGLLGAGEAFVGKRSRRRFESETPALTVARTATRDTELGGVRIPAGALMAVSLGAANRDPGRYPDPDAFDIFREDKQHISFGDGAHKCLGIHLARLEMRILLTAVLDRLPGLRLDPGADDPHIHGLLFRSPPNLPVRFDPA
jgi:hypothetical protein